MIESIPGWEEMPGPMRDLLRTVWHGTLAITILAAAAFGVRLAIDVRNAVQGHRRWLSVAGAVLAVAVLAAVMLTFHALGAQLAAFADAAYPGWRGAA